MTYFYYKIELLVSLRHAHKSKQAQKNITNSIEVTIIGGARGGPGGLGPPNQIPSSVQKNLVSSVSVSFSIFAYNHTHIQQ